MADAAIVNIVAYPYQAVAKFSTSSTGLFQQVQHHTKRAFCLSPASGQIGPLRLRSNADDNFSMMSGIY